jgi:hypothetical protein
VGAPVAAVMDTRLVGRRSPHSLILAGIRVLAFDSPDEIFRSAIGPGHPFTDHPSRLAISNLAADLHAGILPNRSRRGSEGARRATGFLYRAQLPHVRATDD